MSLAGGTSDDFQYEHLSYARLGFSSFEFQLGIDPPASVGSDNSQCRHILL